MMARLALDEEAAKDEALAKGDKRIAELEAALGRLRDEMAAALAALGEGRER
jgi:hypothetical protein